MAELQLLTTEYTPFGLRVQIALTERKIPFELIIVDVFNKPEILLQANPIHKLAPAILHNGKPVAESLVILEYLEDAFPDHAPLMPKDAYERSKVRFWTDYVYKTFDAMTASFIMKRGSPEQQAANEGILANFQTLESGMTSFSPEGPFFTGDKFGYVDVVLAPLCVALVLLENVAGMAFPGPDDLPRFHKWMEAIRAYPSVISVLPSPEDTIAYLKANFLKRAAEAAAAAAAAK